jgi:C1A family cysteine protease
MYLEATADDYETEYTYKAQTGTCSVPTNGHVNVLNIANVTPYFKKQLMAAIAEGVVSVTIEADQAVFQRYTSGILNTKECGTQLDHAVAAVGYGTENGQDYYIVRNSWGPSWGEEGYIRIAAIDGAGICGIQ